MSATDDHPARRRVLSRRRVVALAVCLAGVAVLAARGRRSAVMTPGTGGPASASAKPGQSVRDTEEAQAHPEPESAEAHPLAASPDEAATAEEGISPGAPSDEEVRRDLRELERYYGRRPGAKGGGVTVSGGFAQTPPGAPRAVEQAVAGGNAIAQFPYRWGGGHGSFIDDAYDCSGSVSYALAAAGMLDAPLASGDLRVGASPVAGGGSPSTRTPATCTWRSAGCASTPAGAPGGAARAGRRARRSGRGFEARHWPGL